MLVPTSTRVLARSAAASPLTCAASSSFSHVRLAQRTFSASARKQDDDAALLESIKSKLKDSMRARDSTSSTVLRSLLSEYQYAQKQPNAASGTGSPASLSVVLQKAAAKRAEAAAQFRAATPSPREDLAEKEDAEAKIIKAFLPEPMSREELEGVVRQVLDSIRGSADGAGVEAKKLVGQVIKGVNAVVDKARVTGGEVSKAVNDILKQS
ncbi:unnamed protein product [Tilletia controversa]|uniref:Altered inheritance of mitochondria protein 41 n=3 Tax=Tilletia TaxID=13289 RepID=A0A8X7SX81_9BASI|nr:hypothetical protein CF336_g4289 [Tilletia laevis]KAE8197442.1 hypothetical protein CF328_g3844 [Tilletia controversa]KAE8257025.1 hypothetical protein A4X03_0g4815 [Tilletia caries]KAE8202360.1 hypothetical protein CF335_g3448 [Tilletia laevis]KAE8247421.1 hypothetical protein A4X06_0g4474 [Tilletia controversa]